MFCAELAVECISQSRLMNSTTSSRNSLLSGWISEFLQAGHDLHSKRPLNRLHHAELAVLP